MVVRWHDNYWEEPIFGDDNMQPIRKLSSKVGGLCVWTLAGRVIGLFARWRKGKLDSKELGSDRA